MVGPQIDFDVVTEMGFVDRAAYEAWWKEMTNEGAREKLSDEDRTRIVVGGGVGYERLSWVHWGDSRFDHQIKRADTPHASS